MQAINELDIDSFTLTGGELDFIENLNAIKLKAAIWHSISNYKQPVFAIESIRKTCRARTECYGEITDDSCHYVLLFILSSHQGCGIYSFKNHLMESLGAAKCYLDKKSLERIEIAIRRIEKILEGPYNRLIKIKYLPIDSTAELDFNLYLDRNRLNARNFSRVIKTISTGQTFAPVRPVDDRNVLLHLLKLIEACPSIALQALVSMFDIWIAEEPLSSAMKNHLGSDLITELVQEDINNPMSNLHTLTRTCWEKLCSEIREICRGNSRALYKLNVMEEHMQLFNNSEDAFLYYPERVIQYMDDIANILNRELPSNQDIISRINHFLDIYESKEKFFLLGDDDIKYSNCLFEKASMNEFCDLAVQVKNCASNQERYSNGDRSLIYYPDMKDIHSKYNKFYEDCDKRYFLCDLQPGGLVKYLDCIKFDLYYDRYRFKRAFPLLMKEKYELMKDETSHKASIESIDNLVFRMFFFAHDKKEEEILLLMISYLEPHEALKLVDFLYEDDYFFAEKLHDKILHSPEYIWPEYKNAHLAITQTGIPKELQSHILGFFSKIQTNPAVEANQVWGQSCKPFGFQ